MNRVRNMRLVCVFVYMGLFKEYEQHPYEVIMNAK